MAERSRTNRPVLAIVWIARLMAAAAAACLLSLIGVTLLDIVGRSLSAFQVRGVLEVSSLTMILLAYFALAWGFLKNAHIVVDLATSHLSRRTNAGIDRFWIAVSAVWLAVLAHGVWQSGFAAHASGERSVALGWSPLATAIPASAGLLLAALTCLLIAITGRIDTTAAENEKEEA